MARGSKARLFVAGLILGALLFAIAPVGAHHNDANLKTRVSALEAKVTKLVKKTKYLTADGGNYGGNVYASSVWSRTTDGCADGENALWVDDGEPYVILSCPGGTSASAAARP